MSYILELFFHSKNCLKNTTLVASLTLLWVKKEFPNVTRKIISSPQAKNFREKIRSLWQVFSILVSPPQAKKHLGKIRSLRQVSVTKRENGHWDRRIGCLKKKQIGEINVSVTVNSVASLQKNMPQWQTFGEMKLKIKKTKQKKTI